MSGSPYNSNGNGRHLRGGNGTANNAVPRSHGRSRVASDRNAASGHNGGESRAEARTMIMPAERYKGPEAPAVTHPGTGSSGDRTDEQLLGDYRHGDKTSFGQLVGRYQRELYHFLVRFLGNRASAEDVFQETFLQVHQSAEQFDPQRRFRPWLFTIAANKARDLIRSQARRPTNPLQAPVNSGDDESGEFIDLMQSAADLPSEPMEKQELQRQVQDTVGGMPEHLREILLLSYFHQFPYKQISEILDIPLGTVKSRLHAAVAHFADRWRSASQREANSSGHASQSNHRKPSA